MEYDAPIFQAPVAAAKNATSTRRFLDFARYKGLVGHNTAFSGIAATLFSSRPHRS